MSNFFHIFCLFFIALLCLVSSFVHWLNRGENHGDNYVSSSNICLQYFFLIEDCNVCCRIEA